MEWIFYYDEAFHDRKITVKNNKINIYASNASDIYLGVFNGYKLGKQEEIHNKFKEFEEKYKKIYTKEHEDEFKATVIRKANYKYGFASFKKNTVKFFNDFFDILSTENIVLHICLFSKTEYLVKNFLDNINVTLDVANRKAFEYVIVKFLFNHRNVELLAQIIHAQSEIDIVDIIKKLRIFMKEVINEGISSPRMVPEVNALKENLYLLSKVKVKNKLKKNLEWNYKPVFKGFNSLLKNRNIAFDNIQLIIDEDEKTLKTAKQIGKYKCENGKSHENIGIRISDILSHFFAEIALALQDELKEEEILDIGDMKGYDLKTKRLLSLEWFKLKEEQFILCKKIQGILTNYQAFEWTVNSGNFCDYSRLVFSFISYIDSYDTYEDFKKCLDCHSELFNIHCTKDLESFFNSIGTHTALNTIIQ